MWIAVTRAEDRLSHENHRYTTTNRKALITNCGSMVVVAVKVLWMPCGNRVNDLQIMFP